MEILKSTNRAPDFFLVSRRVNGSILEYVHIDATRKPGKKTSCMVEVDIHDGLPPVHGDEQMLKQVFVNLILNAVVFSKNLKR